LIKKFAKQDIKYLMNKYNKNNISNNNKNNIKKKIFINIVGNTFKKTYLKRIIEGLEKDFAFIFTDNDPDYLVYDVYNCEFLSTKYKNAIKISFYSENILPDFNKADYAIAFHNLNYLDRYYKRTALISVFEYRFKNLKNKALMNIRNKVINNKIKRNKFCAGVISNYYNSDGFRLKFIKELSKYKKIDLGGSRGMNIGKGIKSKIQFFSSYKFSIAMENSEGEGYISEKIIDSFLAGTIPIYYGGYNIDQYLNNKAFILIRGEKDMREKINYIIKIDNDEELYKKLLKEKVIIDDKFAKINIQGKIEFLKHIFEQDKEKAKRIDNYHWK
jgi:hypothetical protein